jgi:hypothetical protein
LVCKAWLHSARFHLFYALAVEDDVDVEELLETTSAAIPFIRHLLIDGPRDWCKWDVNLPLFVGFRNLTSLTLSHLLAQFLEASAESALFDNFSSVVVLRLLKIQCGGVAHLVRLICAFPRLRKLVVDADGLYVENAPFEWNLPPRTAFRLSPSLVELELGAFYMGALLLWFLSLPERPVLRSVYLHQIEKHDLYVARFFLATLQGSLETFFVSTQITDGALPIFVDLINTHSKPGPHWPFDLSRHTQLRSVQISLLTVKTVIPDPDHTRWVTQMLSRITSVHIASIRLELYVNIDDRHRLFLGWDEVDAVLQKTSFSGLEDVTVWFLVDNWRDPMVPTTLLPSYLTDQLPLCNARGILSFDSFRGRPWDSYL